MSITRSIIHQTATTAATTLAIQLTAFTILALAPLILPTEDFAQLSVIVSATMLSSAFFDLGLNLTSTKFYGETGSTKYFQTAFRIQLTCIPIGALLWALAEISNYGELGVGIFCGAMLNLWNGLRATDQARQDYQSFGRASLIFAIMRLLLGVGALILTHEPVLTALAVYAIPTLAGISSNSWPLVTKALRRKLFRPHKMAQYASFVHLNALIFVGLPYLPVFLIDERLSHLATGTYGLILTFTAPVALLVYSLRSVLLPKMLGGESKLELALWSTRGTLAVISIGILGCFTGYLISLLIDALYGDRFPDIALNFIIYFAGYSLTATIGIYSLSIHTKGVPQIAITSALIKAGLMFALLVPFGNSLLSIVTITSAIMMIGELILVAQLYRARSWKIT